MALKKCRGCSKKVYHSAETCPHCGAKRPGMSSNELFYFYSFLVIIFSVLVIFMADYIAAFLHWWWQSL